MVTQINKGWGRSCSRGAARESDGGVAIVVFFIELMHTPSRTRFIQFIQSIQIIQLTQIYSTKKSESYMVQIVSYKKIKRGTTVKHKNLYISLFLLTISGSIYDGPP